jgi:aminoglycoside phosphotransferase (APT) family kinase protein
MAASSGIDLDAMLGLPTEAEFVARYMAARTRRRRALLAFHKAFALYRFAVIFVGISDRARAGTASDPDAASLAPLARRFAIRAMELTERAVHF